jgi:hypothetical protein
MLSTTLSANIAALSHERTSVQRELHEYRHCRRDERHEQWESALKDIELRRQALVDQQRMVLKRSKECGVYLNDAHV